MLGYIKYTLYLMLLLPFIAGCSEELPVDDPWAVAGDELPIEFDFSMPVETRGFDGDVKTAFTNGDVIHILGTFETRELQEDGTYKTGAVKRYGALSYGNKKWTPLAGSKLTWPSVSVNGTFEAYYIYGSNGVLTGATTPQPVFLANVKPATGDPMQAHSEEKIVYGHAVELKFKHLCAYLTLVDLEPQVATSYWFKRDDNPEFNNAFKFDLQNDANGDPEKFVFEFCAVPYDNINFPGLIYISADAVGQTIFDQNGESRTITKASYFLEPGYYDKFSICYPATTQKVYEYLQYDYNNVPDNSGGVDKENNEPDLEAGTTYTLTITKSPGITINSPSSGEGWHDAPPYYEVDVEDFLKAVNEKKKYDVTFTDESGQQRTVTILEVTAEGTKLLENVDFNYFEYFDYDKKQSNFRDDFVPNISEGNVFDGDYHYIKRLGSPLFRYNYGTIKNLGITDTKITATTYEDGDNYDDRNKDMSRLGALCMWNRQNATITNVRVSGVEMQVTVYSQISTEGDGSETHNIGCVVGSNTGHISEAALSGRFRLDVTGTETNSSVLIGGFLGQNAAEGTLYDVTPLESDLKITINNTCRGNLGSYSVGGVVGESTGTISGVILSDITIDGTQSSGVTSYMGGIAGQLAVSEGVTTPTFVEACVISGSIKAGTTVKYGAITSGSYIGSISGSDLNVPVQDCRTVVSVYGSKAESENVIYATGGAFGRIRDAANYTFENLIIYGSALDGLNAPAKKQFIGNFAGVTPLGQSWETDYSAHNILLRSFVDENIGGNLDSNNNNE